MRDVHCKVLKSATFYSVDTSVSTQALEQCQLVETRYKNKQNRSYHRIKEASCLTKEYGIGEG